MALTPCPHRPSPEPSAPEITTRLTRAALYCALANERWTAPRQRIYELLVRAGRPVKAYDLITMFAPGRFTKPPTVYRVLDFLVRHGLAQKVESQTAFLACEPDGALLQDLLVCDCCGEVEGAATTLRPVLESLARDKGFKITQFVVEFKGLCAACAN